MKAWLRDTMTALRPAAPPPEGPDWVTLASIAVVSASLFLVVLAVAVFVAWRVGKRP
jgi:hypothetical protein